MPGPRVTNGPVEAVAGGKPVLLNCGNGRHTLPMAVGSGVGSGIGPGNYGDAQG